MILYRRRALERIKEQSIVSKHQVLGYRISAECRLEIKKASMNFQIVPPDDHRRNLAEKKIQTCKDHFIGVMSKTSEDFLDHLWC